jgi:hypothetical protein
MSPNCFEAHKVTKPMSYAVPIVDPRLLLRITTAVLYLWPVALVSIVSQLRWRSLKKRIPFMVLGYLVCAGVQSIMGVIGYTFSWIHYIGAVPQEQIVVALVNTSLSVTAIATVVSVAPVVWLSQVCGQKDSMAAT